MGLELTANCASCGYKSSRLIIGDGETFVFTCRACNSVVDACRIPFRLDIPKCPSCGAQLQTDWFVDVFNRTRRDPPVPCLRCPTGTLEFRTLAPVRFVPIEYYPSIGRHVHLESDEHSHLRIAGTHYIEPVRLDLDHDPGPITPDFAIEARVRHINLETDRVIGFQVLSVIRISELPGRAF